MRKIAWGLGVDSSQVKELREEGKMELYKDEILHRGGKSNRIKEKKSEKKNMR